MAFSFFIFIKEPAPTLATAINSELTALIKRNYHLSCLFPANGTYLALIP